MVGDSGGWWGMVGDVGDAPRAFLRVLSPAGAIRRPKVAKCSNLTLIFDIQPTVHVFFLSGSSYYFFTILLDGSRTLSCKRQHYGIIQHSCDTCEF